MGVRRTAQGHRLNHLGGWHFDRAAGKVREVPFAKDIQTFGTIAVVGTGTITVTALTRTTTFGSIAITGTSSIDVAGFFSSAYKVSRIRLDTVR